MKSLTSEPAPECRSLRLLNHLRGVIGIELKYRITERRPGDIEKIWADPSFANKRAWLENLKHPR